MRNQGCHSVSVEGDDVGSGSARAAPYSLGTMTALEHIPSTGVGKSYNGVSTYQVFLETKLISRHS